jgi:hypothetical protein
MFYYQVKQARRGRENFVLTKTKLFLTESPQVHKNNERGAKALRDYIFVGSQSNLQHHKNKVFPTKKEGPRKET